MAENIQAKLPPYIFCHSFRTGGNFILDDNVLRYMVQMHTNESHIWLGYGTPWYVLTCYG